MQMLANRRLSPALPFGEELSTRRSRSIPPLCSPPPDEGIQCTGTMTLDALIQAAASEFDPARVFEAAAGSIRCAIDASCVAVLELRPSAGAVVHAVSFASQEASKQLEQVDLAAVAQSLGSAAPILRQLPGTDGGSVALPFVAAPIVRHAAEFGALLALGHEGRSFSAADLAIVQLGAGILSLALQRIHADHLARSQWVALSRTVAALAGGPELDGFLAQVLAVIGEEVRAQRVVLWLYNPQHDVLSATQIYDPASPDLRPSSPRSGAAFFRASEKPLWRRIVRSGEIAAVADLRADPQLQARQWLADCSCAAMLLVPLIASEQPIGCIAIGTQTADYPPEDLLWLRTLAQQATLAVHLASLAEQSRRAAILEERNRMAREIHDTLAQGFTGILMQIEALEDRAGELPPGCLAHLAQARELARASLAEARRSVWSLRLHALEGYDLPGAFTRLIGQMTSGSPVAARFRVHGVPRPLRGDTEAHILRIGLEALTNAIKHAGASAIRIELTYKPASVRLSVRDDGKGFEVSKAPGGFGLAGMRERASCMGAKLTIRSKPGQGTSVVLTIPTPDNVITAL